MKRPRPRNIGFLWDNFGPTHVDACTAVSDAVPADVKVVGIEIFSASDTYEWGRWIGNNYDQVTLFKGAQYRRAGVLKTAARIVATCRDRRLDTIFMCHYQMPAIFLAAIMLRMLGRRLIVLSDSKFDDYQRHLYREIGKSIYMAPYDGALVASRRSGDYIRFLGVDPRNIRIGYYGIDFDRVRTAAAAVPAPGGAAHGERHFLCIARLVEKKNHLTLIDGFARYARASANPRRLVLCGSGPMEAVIRDRVAGAGIAHLVDIMGNLSPSEVAAQLGTGLCLLLPSISEQFGIVVSEAEAMGLPIILSDNCGARDDYVRSGVNGFVIEPDNVEGLAYFIGQLADDEVLWRRMATASRDIQPRGDVRRLVGAVLDLCGFDPGPADGPQRGETRSEPIHESA